MDKVSKRAFNHPGSRLGPVLFTNDISQCNLGLCLPTKNIIITRTFTNSTGS